MNIAVYTTEMKDVILEGIQEFKEEPVSGEISDVKVDVFDKREELLYKMRTKKYGITIVAENGAKGFEAALGIRNDGNQVPLIWITGDEVFGIQSYRMRVQDFLVTPVTPKQISDSLSKCMEYV